MIPRGLLGESDVQDLQDLGPECLWLLTGESLKELVVLQAVPSDLPCPLLALLAEGSKYAFEFELELLRLDSYLPRLAAICGVPHSI